MCKNVLFSLYFSFAVINAAIRVPQTELYQENGIWYDMNTNSPFNGVSYKTSDYSNMLVQQINYIDGIEWGKYYEWWPDGTKRLMELIVQV